MALCIAIEVKIFYSNLYLQKPQRFSEFIAPPSSIFSSFPILCDNPSVTSPSVNTARFREGNGDRFNHFFFSSKNPEMKSSDAAMQMQESATLKVGHQPWLLGMIFSKPGSQMLMKSTT